MPVVTWEFWAAIPIGRVGRAVRAAPYLQMIRLIGKLRAWHPAECPQQQQRQ